ncbi:MAG: hypothetical protein L0Y76_13110 [Ignavibacteria bacterium]|nr:hypothetical protein [Ignavibacteria bacterium]
MKHIFLAVIALLMLSSCTKSQVIIPAWSSLIYSYDCGPLPPPHHYEYTLSINADGSAIYTYQADYEGKKVTTQSFKLTDEQLAGLTGKLDASKIFTNTIQKLDEGKHPIGGSLENVKVFVVNPDPNLDQPPQVFESPYFPTEEFKPALEELYSYIKELVPSQIKENN